MCIVDVALRAVYPAPLLLSGLGLWTDIGMTVSERKRIDKIKKALRFIFSECSEHIVEQATREKLREDEIRDLAAMLLTSLTLEEGPLLPVSDVHEDTLLLQ